MQYTCPKTSLLPGRECDVQDKENTWQFTTRHCRQGFVENPPVLATSHGHVQGEDGHIQGTKIFQQGRVCWILSPFKCVQEVHNARGEGDAKPEDNSNAKRLWKCLKCGLIICFNVLVKMIFRHFQTQLFVCFCCVLSSIPRHISIWVSSRFTGVLYILLIAGVLVPSGSKTPLVANRQF